MKTSIISALLAITIASPTWAKDKGQEISKLLIPTGNQSATWESKCSLSMKGKFTVNEDATFSMKLNFYSSTNCEEGSEYLSLSRTGKYKFQARKMSKVTLNDGSYYWYYDYEVNPDQLKLDLSPILVDSDGALGTLANGLLSMYEGCIGTQSEENKNLKCRLSGISNTKSRVKLSNMKFITPTTMLADFNDDVQVEFNLVECGRNPGTLPS